MRLSRKWLLAAALAMLTLGSPMLVNAQGFIYAVRTTSDSVVPGACNRGDAFCSLRGAIQASNSHVGEDVIQFNLPAGSVINLNQALPDITESVTITGPGANLLTVRRNTSQLHRIFSVTTTGTVTISGLTISNGIGFGGGVANTSTGTINLSACRLYQNLGSVGGGIFNNGTVNILSSTLDFNQAGDNGGGIANYGTLRITNSTLHRNYAQQGYGGGIFNNNGAVLVITNSTVSENIAYIGGGIADFGMVEIKSTLIAQNHATRTAVDAPDVLGFYQAVSHGFNFIGNNIGADPAFPPGNPNANNDIVGTSAAPIDPQLGGLQDNGGPTWTRALLPGSPAIDKGSSDGLTGSLTTDQRGAGFARSIDYPGLPNAPGGNGTDIGAFELLMPTAVSRKTHGADMFDLPLPVLGPAGIECRNGGMNGDHVMIVTFSAPVTSVLGVNVPSGTGSVSSYSVSGSEVTVNLTGVTNAQSIVVHLFAVRHGTSTSNVVVPMGVLMGDSNGDGFVNAGDALQTRNRSGQATDATNFRSDVNADGFVNSGDATIVRSRSGTALP